MYGKDDTDYIVNISVKKDEVFIYKRMPGGLRVETAPMKYYILKPDYSEGDIILEGKNHYKYVKPYKTNQEWNTAKRYAKQDKKDIMTINNKPEQYMTRNGQTYFKGMKPEDLNILSFDIETTGLTHDNGSFVTLISNTFRDHHGNIQRRLFKYDDYVSDKKTTKACNKDMIADWCSFVREMDPDVLTGHNIFGFDLPYLKFCADGPLHLGRDGSSAYFNKYESEFRKDGSQSYTYTDCTIFGREVVDTMFLAIKFATPNGRDYESYGLKPIIEHEGLEKEGRIKWDWEKYPPGKTFTSGKKVWDDFCQYCKDDGDDALKLFDLMIPSYFYLNRSIPMSLQKIINRASGAQVNSFMVRSYLQEGHSIARASQRVSYEGAISFGNPGLYSNVYKVDVASLYPSIIRQHQITNKSKDPKGYFLKMVEVFTEERLKNKAKGAAGDVEAGMLEKAQKIIINSAYGFLGSSGLNYNSPKDAALVTRIGREILTTGINWAESNGYDIVNVDTDSFSFSNGKKLENFQETIDKINDNFDDMIVWEDDGVYDKFLVIKAKNYVTVQGKKIKYKGGSIKDAKKEPILKEMMLEIIDNILAKRKDVIYDTYLKYIMKAGNIQDITKWCSKKTITKAVLEGDRTNEVRIREAYGDKVVQEGDKIYIFKSGKDSLSLRENFNGEYYKPHFYKRIHSTIDIFKLVLDVGIFPNFSLARNKDRI